MLRVSISEAAGWLGDSVGLFYVSLLVWRILSGRLPSWSRWLGLPQRSETDIARETMRRLRDIPPRGFSRVWSSFLLAVIAGSWILWGTTAIVDHARIRDLQASLARYEMPLTNIHTWFNVQIIHKSEIDPGHYLVHVEGRQKPEALFLCPDSLNDADWDVGMTLLSVTFESRAECKSIHAESLGFYVHRDPKTLKFIHYEKEYD